MFIRWAEVVHKTLPLEEIDDIIRACRGTMNLDRVLLITEAQRKINLNKNGDITIGKISTKEAPEGAIKYGGHWDALM